MARIRDSEETGRGAPRRDAAHRPRRQNLKREYKAPALDKGLEILELLAGQSHPVAMADIAHALGRSTTEIFRMLHVLEGRGYIEREPANGRYQVTEALFQLGMRKAPKRNLHSAALPVMERLAEQSRQSCHLGLVSGNDIIVIARAESPGAVSFSVKLGYRVPVVDSTSGRVVFAFQSEERQKRWLERLRAHNKRMAVKAFKADIAKIAKQGYALEPSRYTDGIQDIGAPILGPTGEAVASLTMPFVTHRRFNIALDKVIPMVLDAAREISARLTGC